MVNSIYSKSNFIRFLLLEILLTSLVSFLGFGLLIFFLLMQLEVKTKNPNLIFLLENPSILALILLIPVAIINLITLSKRKRNYIVGFFFEDEKQILKIQYRKLEPRNIINIEIPYPELQIESFYDTKFFFNQTYKGIRILINNKQLDFVSNNFIWEEDIHAKKYFLIRMKELSEKNEL